ncbi:MAG: cysteine-rich CWC family protein [Polaromonas sp.]
MTEKPASTCPQCGAGLRCGAVSGDETCWCFDMPRVVALPSSDLTQKASCLCRNCLQQLIDSNDTKNLPATAN